MSYRSSDIGDAIGQWCDLPEEPRRFGRPRRGAALTPAARASCHGRSRGIGCDEELSPPSLHPRLPRLRRGELGRFRIEQERPRRSGAAAALANRDEASDEGKAQPDSAALVMSDSSTTVSSDALERERLRQVNEQASSEDISSSPGTFSDAGPWSSGSSPRAPGNVAPPSASPPPMPPALLRRPTGGAKAKREQLESEIATLRERLAASERARTRLELEAQQQQQRQPQPLPSSAPIAGDSGSACCETANEDSCSVGAVRSCEEAAAVPRFRPRIAAAAALSGLVVAAFVVMMMKEDGTNLLGLSLPFDLVGVFGLGLH
eukprot:TRINITY_DN26660_c0_g2_i1.p1 TRINITY_DN26660_c0_g2~~TRINITY_DN26660_c0_g2_i1.p1  ORF type:complete len:320 (-),score=62.71 TRINITY_DN26660_c0_g2_i1:174-1133(-)